MSAPKNWKCRFGFHDWRHDGEAVIGGYVYQASPHIEVEVGTRTIYFRKCTRCPADRQYYPTPTQLVAIIKARGPVRSKQPQAESK